MEYEMITEQDEDGQERRQKKEKYYDILTKQEEGQEKMLEKKGKYYYTKCLQNNKMDIKENRKRRSIMK